jgi:hypothetical protein
MTPMVPGAIATLLTTAVLFLALPASAQIQPFDAPGTSATVSANAWWTFGGSKWEQDFDVVGLGTVGSKLDWKDVDIPVGMVTGDFAWRYLVLSSAGVGWGQAITDGTFIDEDFSPAWSRRPASQRPSCAAMNLFRTRRRP